MPKVFAASFTFIKVLWLESWTYYINCLSMSQQASASIPYIVVGIDGTGSRQWRKADGRNSSVFKFVRDFHYGTYGVDKIFFDGPSDVTYGIESEPILQHALDFVNHRLQQLFPQLAQRNVHPLSMFDVNSFMQSNERARADFAAENGGQFFGTSTARVPVQVTAQMLSHQTLSTNQVRIVIIGHSRGGLVANVLARMLSPVVKVYFLGLYDAVDRQPNLDGGIVENVKYVYHARRNPEVGSRWYFNNTATVYHTEEPPQEKFFYSSHGGIGGSLTPGEFDRGFFSDQSCVPQPPTRVVVTRGGAVIIPNINPLTRRFGKPIDQICIEGGQQADAFIRDGARRAGLPIQ